MTSFDLFIIVTMGLSVLFAWVRGLSRETVTLLAIGAGIFTVQLFGTGFSSLFGTGVAGPLIALALLFLLGFAVASIGLELVVARIWGRDPSRPDRIAGAVFGLVRGWFLMGLALFAVIQFHAGEKDLPPPFGNALLIGLIKPATNLLERWGLEDVDPVVIESPDTAATAERN
ncbi:CvpA family protein [Parvularcula sp. LCG005]|uniref:CvpA family protein n=1 Tax=Parvularcula sp. LCG005 TaxID=3078805 RepID=UPI0029438F5D|nr:CvpA family protein [Parvularcula sp. LCG005]WOI52863.1 CvpA family protein [Parvularcula sp. LCG005]